MRCGCGRRIILRGCRKSMIEKQPRSLVLDRGLTEEVTHFRQHQRASPCCKTSIVKKSLAGRRQFRTVRGFSFMCRPRAGLGKMKEPRRLMSEALPTQVRLCP